MKRQFHRNRLALALAAAAGLSACQTVNMPKISEIMKSPEFSEDAARIGNDYPDIRDAPYAPTDVRSDGQWDDDARSLEALRDDVNRIPMEAGPTPSEADREFEALRAKAQAYKKEDPASGLAMSIPDYKRRAVRP